MRRISILVALVALCALQAAAADLGKYAEWKDSPEGWFMTPDERARWDELSGEAEAATFVADFFARRDAKFKDEIATRVAAADKHFTVGKTPGSQSLRGKVIILLGPPSGFDVAPVKRRAGGRTGSVDMMASGGGGDRTGPGLADVAEIDQRDAMAGEGADRIYTIRYAAAQSPTKSPLTIVLEVSGASGKDKLKDKRAMAELQRAFDAAAQASIRQ